MIIVLTGVTGSGKSELAISLAKKLNAGIVNADAFQVYEELNIATAKPSEAMMMEAPHFLFDFIPLASSYSVAEYQQDLRSAIATLEKEGKNVIIAGGTGLYIRAGIYDYRFPEEQEVDLSPIEALSDEELYRQACLYDEMEARSIHPHNRVRLLRLIKMALMGYRKSEVKQNQEHRPLYDCLFLGLEVERSDIYSRVEKRVERMFEAGLVEENRRLVENYGRDCPAFRAIGVKELFPYFDGLISLEQAKDEIKKNTRHYVKRQETFFRHQFDVTYVKGEEDVLKLVMEHEDGAL